MIIKYLSYVGVAVGGAMLYALGYKSIELLLDYIKDRLLRSKREDSVDLSGRWYAVWETTADGKVNMNSELIEVTQRGKKIVLLNLEKSPENKLGGYLWRAEGSLYENEHLLATYCAREKNVVSKGTIYFVLNKNGQFMVGKWVGCNIDFEFTWGFGIICKDKEFGQQRLQQLLALRERNKKDFAGLLAGEGS